MITPATGGIPLRQTLELRLLREVRLGITRRGEIPSPSPSCSSCLRRSNNLLTEARSHLRDRRAPGGTRGLSSFRIYLTSSVNVKVLNPSAKPFATTASFQDISPRIVRTRPSSEREMINLLIKVYLLRRSPSNLSPSSRMVRPRDRRGR